MKKVLLMALLVSPFANGEDVDSANFIKTGLCKDGNSLECTAWVVGAINGFRIQSDATSTKTIYCIPQNVTYGQQKDIFLKFVNEHPEETHHNAALLLYVSLAKAFPCVKKN